MKIKLARRQIISTIVVISAISAVCWDLSTSAKYAQETGTFRLESEFDAVTAATTKVAIVPSDYSELSSPVSRSANPSEDQIEDMVRKAIELQGGLDWVINNGDKVMIKVNLVGGSSSSGDGENTDVRVVKALINIINEHTDEDVEILVAEGTARTNDVPTDAGSVWDNSGYPDLLVLPNVTLLNLNQTYAETVEITLGKNAVAMPHDGKYRVHEEEIDADVYISVPVLKIHDTGITNALKNQIGTAPGSAYGYNKTKGGSYSELVHDVDHRRWTTEEIVDFCSVADIDFVVVDAIMCLEEYKSFSTSRQVRMNTIIAGVDPVAVDHVGAKLFCLNPDDIAHITLAEKVGLGTNNPANIELVGAPVDEVKKKVRKNPSENGKFGQSNRTWVLSQPFSSTDIDEELLTGEDTLEPIAGQNSWSEPVYFFDDRIDLLSYYQGQEDIITYAFSYFYSPESKEAELWVGSHEDIKVYINGESVYSFSGINVYGDNDIYTQIVDIDVLEGQNTLMVKTLNQYNDYSFALNICDLPTASNYDGNRVDGLKFYTADADTAGTDTVIVQPNTQPTVENPLADVEQDEGFGSYNVNISDVFNDADGDSLTYIVESDNNAVVTVSIVDTTVTLTEVGPGTATVTVTADDGFGGIATESFTITVNNIIIDVGDIDMGSYTVQLYPNPSSGVVYLRYTEDPDQNIHVKIYDIAGQQVYSDSFRRIGSLVELNLTDLISGIYYICIFDTEELISTKKFRIQ